MPSSLIPDPERQYNAGELFSLKEWMAAISSKLDRMETKLDTKADVTHVQAIDLRVAQLEKQAVEAKAEASFIMPQHARMLEDVGVLKTKAATITSVESYRRWVWGTVFLSLLATAVSAIVLLIR